MKRCQSCGEDKPLTSYYKHAGTKDGRRNNCRECAKRGSTRRKRQNAANRPARKFCGSCREEKPRSAFYANNAKHDGLSGYCKACYREKYDGNPEYRRDSHYRRYGLTLADFDAMAAAQGGRCAVCGGPQTGGRRLAVDHCHATGRIRGLLCDRCNQAIGLFRDDTRHLLAAIGYLGLPG